MVAIATMQLIIAEHRGPCLRIMGGPGPCGPPVPNIHYTMMLLPLNKTNKGTL